MDVRLQNDAVFQIVGPSGSGKTLFVTTLLNTPGIFKCIPGKIYWLQGSSDGESGNTNKMLNHLKNIQILNGFEDGWIDLPKRGDVLVVDDLFEEANKEKCFNSLFTKIARHRQITVIFITQNLFHEGGKHRTRNLNVQYLVIFKNPRDQTAIEYIARQAFPHNKQFLIDSYRDAVDRPHGYLFMDFTQQCLDELRLRTDLFNYNGISVYTPI
jgi:ABC-type polar amino acid transport system ATPase subunit